MKLPPFVRTGCLAGTVLLTACAGSRVTESQPAAAPVVMVQTTEPTEAQREMLDAAEAAQESGDYEAAMALFREILAENPTITTAYLGIGEVSVAMSDYDSAELAYSRAARLEPESFEAHYGHGLALQMLGKLIQAVQAYQRALNITPDDVRANRNIATTYLRLGEPRNAMAYAEKAVDLDPASGAAHVNLGAIYERTGRTARAIEEYKAAMELMEPSPELLMNLVNALAAERRYQEAINTAEVLVRTEPSANCYERMGWAYFRLGEYDESIVAYRKAVELDAGHWPSHNGVGVNAINTWLLSGKTDAAAAAEARQAFRRSLQLNPAQPKIIRLLTNYQL